jgi:hypothetical protein
LKVSPSLRVRFEAKANFRLVNNAQRSIANATGSDREPFIERPR